MLIYMRGDSSFAVASAIPYRGSIMMRSEFSRGVGPGPIARIAVLAAALAMLAGCKDKAPDPQPGKQEQRLAAGAARVDADYLASGGDGRDWPATGFSYSGQRYSPLDKINAETIDRLGIAWYSDLPDHVAHDTTPVVVDGVIYIAAAHSKVAAFDAADGRLLWDYDPRLAADFPTSDPWRIANNGIALWKGKLFTTTLDGRLTALDAKTGIPLWSIQAADAGQRVSSTPVVVKNLVIIGAGGAGARGSISAYDIVNGTLRWRFFTTPNPTGEPDKAASDPMLAVATATWSKEGDWRTSGGGGAVADAIVYDAELDQLYFGTGPGLPSDYKARSDGNGDNLFLSSIVAIKPETGEYLWHFQETPAARHDFGASDPIILASLPVEGTTRKLLLHPSNNGYLVALAREDGALVSAVPLAKDVAWAKGYDTGGRPVLPDPIKPEAKKTAKTETATIAPIVPRPMLGWRDGAAASFDPSSALAYVPVQRPRPAMPAGQDEDGGGDTRPLYGKGGLIAMSPLSGRIAWTSGRALGGGVLTSAGGLVFQGARDGSFVAYAAADGEVVWQSQLRGQITGAPATFLSGETQMVAVLTGAPPIMSGADRAADAPPVLGRHSRLVVFALGGKRQLPPPPEPEPATPAAILPGEARPRTPRD